MKIHVGILEEVKDTTAASSGFVRAEISNGMLCLEADDFGGDAVPKAVATTNKFDEPFDQYFTLEISINEYNYSFGWADIIFTTKYKIFTIHLPMTWNSVNNGILVLSNSKSGTTLNFHNTILNNGELEIADNTYSKTPELRFYFCGAHPDGASASIKVNDIKLFYIEDALMLQCSFFDR